MTAVPTSAWPYVDQDLGEWCARHNQPFRIIAEHNYPLGQATALPGHTEPKIVLFDRPQVFAGRVTDVTVIPSDYHACTSDGALIHRGLGVGEINPLKWLGGYGRGRDSNGNYMIDVSDAATPVSQECVFLGGKTNFGHFVFEDLMRLALLAWLPELHHLPVAVYDDLPARYLEFLTLMGVPAERRIAIPRTKPSRFPAAWLLSAPLYRKSPRNIPALWPEAIWAVRHAFAHVIQTVTTMNAGRRPRYYLVRGNAHWRRLVNEPALIKALARHGIVPIDLAGRSARDQIRTVAEAELLVVPVGAGSAITLFAAADCTVVEMGPPDFSAVFGGFGFAAICGRPFVRIVGRGATAAELAAAGLALATTATQIDVDYVIDINEMERILVAAEAYRAGGPPVVALPGRPVGKGK